MYRKKCSSKSVIVETVIIIMEVVVVMANDVIHIEKKGDGRHQGKAANYDGIRETCSRDTQALTRTMPI